LTRIEKTFWNDLKNGTDNKGFVYGINYIDKGDIVDCEWFKTEQERDSHFADDKLSDGEVLDLIYDFCEAQVMSHPILEKIITILKENE